MSTIKFPPLVEAIYISKMNRFIAKVLLKNEEVMVHIPSTGRLDGVLKEGRTCYLKPSTNPKRKTKFSLYLVKTNDTLVCVDSLLANEFVYRLLKENQIPEIVDGVILREVSLEDERIDFIVQGERMDYIEVKSVNRSEHGVACFPDAPTTRGKKHLKNLIKFQSNEIQSHIIFVIQRIDADTFTPCYDRDPEFADLLGEAANHNVKIHVCLTKVTESDISFIKWLPTSFK